MAVSVKRLDLINSRVYMNVDAGSETTITVQDLGSAIKRELQKAPFIDDDKIFIWSGDEVYDPLTGSTTGVVMIMQTPWTIWTEDQGSQHKFRIINGIVTESSNGNPLGMPLMITWSLSEQAVSNVSNLATLESNMDLLLDLAGNDQEWISPGLLKIYDSGGKIGGTTVAEFETRTTAGVQTFVLSEVKQYIRTK